MTLERTASVADKGFPDIFGSSAAGLEPSPAWRTEQFELDDIAPAPVEESEWFSILRDILDRQLRSLEAQAEQARESSRMAWRWSLASLAVAALSLAVAALSLASQLGAFG